MATLTHAESRRLYSWWWDSHINPKNSRWLQEDLADMDIKVKSMIKLIEEDADSFAKRAEMYYKKRPELMKFVEEFYRAYRALAERYNHATGALRQAHQTMEEAFPNEIPFVLSDESPSESSTMETAPHTPEMPPPTSALSDSHNSQKDSLVGASKFHDITKNGEYYEEGNSSECKLLQEEVTPVPKKRENLKIQITSKSAHADVAEVEVRKQKETMSKLKSEQDAALHQLQLSLERISNMETEISRCREEFKKQNDEMLMVVTKLNSAEERCVLLDKVNQALQLDLDSLNQRAKEQQEELDKNQEHSERLNISLQEEHLQAETARLSLEDLHSQSQEEVKLLALEVQSGIEKLKNMEMYTVGLEEEVRELKEEIGSLNEQILASAFKIINLQDEIIFLKDSKAKLEDELGLHIEEKKVLQQEFSCLKEDRYELEQRRHRLTEQIESVNFNVESLHAMVKELQDGNAEVREICRKHEDEKGVHLDNLKHMEKISEKIKTLEESSESLNDKISVHVSEKAVLMSKLESVAQNMEDLSERNAFLEKSLSDANVELEGLREKLIGLEESCQSQCAQNSELHSEKSTLVSQIERTTQNLENLETRYAELEGKHLNLEREKDLALCRVMELQDSLKHEKEEYETLILSNKPKMSTLENQIHLLREESWVREELLEVEQRKIMDAQIAIFILQRCLCDMNEKTSILSVEYQKHLVTLKSTEKLISKLNQELLAQEKKLTTSSGCSEKLREGIQLTLRELSVNKECGSLDGIKDEVLLQQTLHEVRDLLNSLSDAQDEKQHILLEKSVIVTILEQFGAHLMDRTLEKNVLERESIIKSEELSVVISQLDSAAQSMENLSGKNTILENFLSDVTVELEGLRGKSKELEESCESLSAQNSELLSEKSTLVSQVQISTQSVEILEMGYAELESKHLNLEREKDLSFHQVVELQDSLKRMKEEYETLILSGKTQLSTLENQNCLLHEEIQVRVEEFQVEQYKIMESEIEIFILQRSLCDMNEKNSILSVECQKHLVDEKLISELKHELHVLEKQWTMSSGHSEKLREGILQMLRELHISKDCWSLDGMKDEVLLHLTLRAIRDLLSSISDAHDENQLIHLEKSIIVTILEQFRVNLMDLIFEKKTLERTSLIKTKELSVLQSKEIEILQMNEQLREDVLSSNQSQMILKAEMEVLRRQLIDSRDAHGTLQSEVCKLLEENQYLSEKNYDLKESKDALEEENSIILAEVTGLECLYTIYMSSMEEKALELKLLSDNRACLHGVKKGLDQEITLINEKLAAVEEENVSLKETVVNLEECRRRSMILEDDLNTTRIVCKQLNREIESRTDLLAQKSIKLIEANQKLQSTQDENTELCRNLESLQLDIGTAMVVIGELENKIFSLLEDTPQRDNKITYPRQANEISNWELDSLRKEVEELRRREEHLNSELQKGVDEVNSCEVEIATLLNDIHITTVNAAVFQEKIVELSITCESFEVSAIVQKETLHAGITRRNPTLEGLNEKLDTMEGENQSLREELTAYLLLVTALWDDITALEELILSLAKHQPSNHREKQDNSPVSLQHCDSCQEPIEYQGATVPAGILEYQKLSGKVQTLQKVVIDTRCLLEQEVFEFNASLAAAMKEIQVLKSRGNSGQEEAQISKERGDARISRVKYEQMMKDIELDILLGSSRYENGAGSDGPSTIENAGSSDRLLELWEATERDCNNQTHKASSVAPVQEIEYYKIEDEEQKIELPFSELEPEKDPCIHKQELPKRVRGSHREWNKKVIERLSFDAQRLSVLQTSVQGLKRNLEASEISNCSTSFGSDAVEAQLNEAEEAILQLIDTNSKLTKKAQGFSPPSDSPVGKPNKTRDTSRRQISEQARSGSEKVGRLELELHKIRFILLKLEEEHENKRARGAGRRRVVLRDYLYGSIDCQKQKKGPSCGCRRPKTEDD